MSPLSVQVICAGRCWHCRGDFWLYIRSELLRLILSLKSIRTCAVIAFGGLSFRQPAAGFHAYSRLVRVWIFMFLRVHELIFEFLRDHDRTISATCELSLHYSPHVVDQGLNVPMPLSRDTETSRSKTHLLPHSPVRFPVIHVGLHLTDFTHR